MNLGGSISRHCACIEAILWQWLAHVQRTERTELRKLIANALKDIEAAQPYPWLNEQEVAARYPFNAVSLRKFRSRGKGPPFYRVTGSEKVRSPPSSTTPTNWTPTWPSAASPKQDSAPTPTSLSISPTLTNRRDDMTKQHEQQALQREKMSAILWRLIVDIEHADQAERKKLVAAAVDKLARQRPPEWLDERQVAARYPFSLRWLQFARWEGPGPPSTAFKAATPPPFSRVFYHTADLDAFLAKCRIFPQSQN